jgi:hypothetical protein
MKHLKQMRLLHQNKEGEWGKYVTPPNSTQCYWVKASPSEMEMLNGKRRGKANRELNERYAKIEEEVKKELGDLYG